MDNYYFGLMLVLVIPQIETSAVFALNLKLHISSDYSDYLQINWFSEGLKKSKTFPVSVLVEAGAAQDTGSCMPPTLNVTS